MKQNFKFVGGPWDGEYHEVDMGKGRDDLFVAQPSRVSFKIEPIEEPVLDENGKPVLDENEEPVTRLIKTEPDKFTRYTLRHMAGDGGSVWYYASDNWPDMYTISQLVHHYRGRP